MFTSCSLTSDVIRAAAGNTTEPGRNTSRKLQDLLSSPTVDLIISSVDRSVVLLMNVKDDLLFGDHEGDQQSLSVMSISNMNDVNVRLCFHIQV